MGTYRASLNVLSGSRVSGSELLVPRLLHNPALPYPHLSPLQRPGLCTSMTAYYLPGAPGL